MSLETSLDKIRQLRSSKIPSQIKQVSLLDAVELILKEENQEMNATAYFATLLSLLDRQDAQESAVELLAIVVPHVNQGLLASKIDFVVSKLLPILISDLGNGTALIRSAIAVLEVLLLGLDLSAWRITNGDFNAQKTFAGLLALAKDQRPKIRRRAVEAVGNILEHSIGGHQLAFDTALSSVLNSVEDQQIVHGLQLLKVVLKHVSLNPKKQQKLSSLLKLFKSSNEFVVLQTLGVFAEVSKDNSELVLQLLELAPNVNDKQIAPVYLAVLAQMHADINLVFQKVSNYLLSEYTAVVESAGQCLIALLSAGFNNSQEIEMVGDLLFQLLQVKYHAAFGTVCEVCAAFIATLPLKTSSKSVCNIVRVCGALRTSQNDADQVLASAIKVLGPEIVLNLVPLNLDPKTGSGRAWMLPLLNENVEHTNLNYFFTELVPLANQFEDELKTLNETRRAKILQTVADQILTLFGRFCLDCLDEISLEQLQFVLSMLYTRVNLRASICFGLRCLARSELVVKHGTEILKALFNVFQSMSTESRGFVLETCEVYLELLPKGEVFQLFNQVSTMLAQNLQNVELRHTMMDIINAILPHLENEENLEGIFVNLFKTVAMMDDALMQKKAYKALCLFPIELNTVMLQNLMLEMQNQVEANARRTRLQAISKIIAGIPSNGDFTFVFKVLPEAILGTKDQNEKTREVSFDLLCLCGQRFHTSEGGFVDHSLISELRNDNEKHLVSINSYFEMVLAGLAGSTPHMVAATVTALARILFEFHEILKFDKLQEYIELVWMLLESPSKEIVGAVLGFVKVSVLLMSTEVLNMKLETLLKLILAWSNEHKNHFKSKVRHLVERLIRRCGYDAVYNAFPQTDLKLLQNIHKSKERARRKRNEPNQQLTQQQQHQRKFDNEFDQALYGSDSESDVELEDDNDEVKKFKGRQQFLLNGEDPLDLLDENALSKISATKPKQHKKELRHNLNERNGKLVIGRDVEAEKELATKNALSAYVDAVKSGPVRTQSGKLKYLRGKRAQKEDDDDEVLKPKKAAKVGKGVKKQMQNRRRL